MPENSADLTPTPPAHDGVLAEERLSFTGTLASMTHQQAHELTEKNGGVATASVSRLTTMLVIGEEGWPLEENGSPSLKLQQVSEWQHEGAAIRIVQESDWLEMLGLDRRDDEVHRQYTPAMLSQLLDVPVGVIRSWERAGLIRPVRRVFRLPYFNFQEVAGARRLAEMIADGVSKAEIQAGLAKLNHILPDIDQPLLQLELLARDKHVAYRDHGGLVETVSGQRLLDFDVPETSTIKNETTTAEEAPRNVQAHWTADDWFEAACRHLEDQQLNEAVEAFRLCLIDDPHRPDANFQLAEVLYRLGRIDGALERYHVAVELDHNYLEAWTQLGCLHAERGEPQAALEAFDVALDVHAEYPDAHLHKAEILQQLGRIDKAIEHWQTYLKFDTRGPWADNARRRLEAAGVPVE